MPDAAFHKLKYSVVLGLLLTLMYLSNNFFNLQLHDTVYKVGFLVRQSLELALLVLVLTERDPKQTERLLKSDIAGFC